VIAHTSAETCMIHPPGDCNFNGVTSVTEGNTR
jgi:hypothetical protein